MSFIKTRRVIVNPPHGKSEFIPPDKTASRSAKKDIIFRKYGANKVWRTTRIIFQCKLLISIFRLLISPKIRKISPIGNNALTMMSN